MSRRTRREQLARRRAVRGVVRRSLAQAGELDEAETPPVLDIGGHEWRRVDSVHDIPERGVMANHCGRVYVRPYARSS